MSLMILVDPGWYGEHDYAGDYSESDYSDVSDETYNSNGSNALWGRCKMESKVPNFDKLFLHGFWSRSSKILHIAPSTPQLPK